MYCGPCQCTGQGFIILLIYYTDGIRSAYVLSKHLFVFKIFSFTKITNAYLYRFIALLAFSPHNPAFEGNMWKSEESLYPEMVDCFL